MRVDAARHQAVDPAEHGVLLVDQRRDAVAARRQQGRAAPDSRRSRPPPRPEAAVEPQRHRRGRSRTAPSAAEPAERAAGEPAGGKDMDLDRCRTAPGIRRAAIVGDQGDAVRRAASSSSASACGREHVPAGAAGGEDVVARHAHPSRSIHAHKASGWRYGRGGVKRQQHADADRQRQHRRAAIGDERQGHALGRG